jgi:hypothetical protein
VAVGDRDATSLMQLSCWLPASQLNYCFNKLKCGCQQRTACGKQQQGSTAAVAPGCLQAADNGSSSSSAQHFLMMAAAGATCLVLTWGCCMVLPFLGSCCLAQQCGQGLPGIPRLLLCLGV